MARNETEANIEWGESIRPSLGNAYPALRPDTLPPVPPLRRPGQSRSAHLEVVRAEDIRPGMRQIDGRWFYSAAWL
jgi:hypothetical protein